MKMMPDPDETTAAYLRYIADGIPDRDLYLEEYIEFQATYAAMAVHLIREGVTLPEELLYWIAEFLADTLNDPKGVWNDTEAGLRARLNLAEAAFTKNDTVSEVMTKTRQVQRLKAALKAKTKGQE